MHYSKRFIAFGGIVAIAFLIKYNIKKHINQGRNIGYDYI